MAALNDVNFALKLSARSKPIVAHIEKLWPFYGSRPQCWQAVEKLIIGHTARIFKKVSIR
jgi:hypothetical protein